MSDLRLRLDTLRRMGVRQLSYRLRRRYRQKFLYPRKAKALFPWPEVLAEEGDSIPFDERRAAALRPRQPLLDHADELVARRFTYLGLPPQDLGEPADWQRAPLGDPLWQYNLHYGQWAIDLMHAFLVTEERRYRGTCIELLEDWLEGNPVGQRPAWEPYPICRRVVTWSRMAGGLAAGASIGRRFFQRRVEPSLRQQAAFLVDNLEFDVPNNHLIANFKALAWLGLLFPHWPEAGSLRDLGCQGLWREMRRQILADGVHDERSISYHCIVLQDLLEVHWLARRRGVEIPPDVAVTLGCMLAVLEATRGPGGQWPVTADSVAGYPMDPQSLHRGAATVLSGVEPLDGGEGDDAWYAAWLGGCGDGEPTETAAAAAGPSESATRKNASCQLFAQAGWAVLRGPEDDYLFFDGGPLGPPRVLGHGHADVLSFELHGGGRPLLVDPGVYTYRAGEQRDRFRSTAMHNTVTVDGRDQCRFWGPFRVAYPPATGLEADGGQLSVSAWHDGYQRLADGVVHHRRVAWHPGLTRDASSSDATERRHGNDAAWTVHDRLSGTGRHRFRSTLQLALGAAASVEDRRGTARWPDGPELSLEILEAPDGVDLKVEPGEVSPSWNEIVAAPRWVIRWQGEVPSEMTFRLSIRRRSTES